MDDSIPIVGEPLNLSTGNETTKALPSTPPWEKLCLKGNSQGTHEQVIGTLTADPIKGNITSKSRYKTYAGAKAGKQVQHPNSTSSGTAISGQKKTQKQ